MAVTRDARDGVEAIIPTKVIWKLLFDIDVMTPIRSLFYYVVSQG